MTRDGNPFSDEQLDAYLDGRMSPSERAALEAELANHPAWKAETRLHSQIDNALRRQFIAPQPPAGLLRELESAEQADTGSKGIDPSTLMRRTWIGIALTVGVVVTSALIGLVYLVGRGSRPAPVFQARPLVDIYRETIAQGFAPYFECNDAKRFAATFRRRQGMPLRLAQLPAGCKMAGLANSGGLSPKTTSMLCYDHQQPVLVFVDRLEADQPLATENLDPNLFVHRKEYRGLVIYEVSPFADARFMDYLDAIEDRDS